MSSPASDAGCDRRLRVAAISFDFPDFWIPLANALAARADVLALFPEDQLASRRHQLDPRLHARPFKMPRLRQPLRQLRMCRRLAGQIRAFDAQVVHVQQGHLWFNLMLPLLRRRRAIVVTVHDPTPHVGDIPSRLTPQALANIAFRSADRVIVHSEAAKEGVRPLLKPGTAVDVVPLVVEVDDLREPPTDEMPGPVVLFFGRIWPYKGLEYLVRAEPRIASSVPDVRIVIAGEGEDLERYRRLMCHPERFEIRNEFVPEDEVTALFRSAAVVIAPYIDATQSGVIPLAYAVGRPVVATCVGGLPEMIDDGVTGFLVPPRDETALADAVVRLLCDPKLWREMSTAARRRVEKQSSPDAAAEQTLVSYESVLAQRGRT